MRTQIIDAAVRNLRAYGYPKVTAKNITTHRIYAAFFKDMLESNKGVDDRIDPHIDALIAECAKATQ